MADVRIQFDLGGFRNTLNRYLRTTSRSRARALNGKAYEIAARAERHTKRADRGEIEALGVVGIRLRKNRKTGTLKKGANIYDTGGRGRAILIAKLKRDGQAIPSGAEVDSMTRRMISRRLSAIGYIASGWIPAIRKLFRFADFKLGRGTSKQRGKPNGYAIAATEGSLTAEIANSVDALEKGSVQTLAEQALARAFNEAQADMEAYLLRKEKQAAQEAGIPTR